MANTISSISTCKIPLILIVLFLSVFPAAAEPGRWETELSGDCWKLWLDSETDWQDDDIYLPPVNIGALPVTPPTCGWENLDIIFDKTVSVPGTVEEYFWSANDNPNGNAGDYRGVSWWSTTFELESALRGKRIIIAFESVNLRAEVFVNRKLVGYDVIGNTPFDVNVTDAVVFDGENQLDVRVTDPVGTFSWNDENLLRWGKNRIPSVHGFGGITGRIVIHATDAVHVNDIYVQNKPEIKEVETFVTLGNSSGTTQNGSVTCVIREWKKPSQIIWEKTISTSVSPEGKEVSFYVRAPGADVWDIKDPHLILLRSHSQAEAVKLLIQ